MRTFSRAEYNEAMAEWAAGDFSEEWRSFRHQAAMKGIIHPPAGTKLDSWDDDDPSDRALLIRAIRETPNYLQQCIDKSKGWPEVVARVIRQRDETIELREADERFSRSKRERDELDHSGAAMTIAEIFGRIADSAGIDVLPSRKNGSDPLGDPALTVGEAGYTVDGGDVLPDVQSSERAPSPPETGAALVPAPNRARPSRAVHTEAPTDGAQREGDAG